MALATADNVLDVNVHPATEEEVSLAAKALDLARDEAATNRPWLVMDGDDGDFCVL